MVGAANDDWPEGQLVVVPHARSGDNLWQDMQTEARDRIGVALRAIYADTLLQPLSRPLAKLVYQIRTQQEISQHGG
jgi:hypothetical protein